MNPGVSPPPHRAALYPVRSVYEITILDNVFWQGVGWLIGRFPRRLLDAGYRLVVANRHVVGGGEKKCDIEYGERILREKEERR